MFLMINPLIEQLLKRTKCLNFNSNLNPDESGKIKTRKTMRSQIRSKNVA